MAIDPGGQILALNKADKAVATVGKGHDEHPQGLHPLANADPGQAEIHLHLLSRRRLQAHGHLRGDRRDVAAEEAFDTGIAQGEPLFGQQSPYLFRRHIGFLQPVADLLRVGLEQLLPEGNLGACGLTAVGAQGRQHSRPLRIVAAAAQAMASGQLQVLAHRLPRLAKAPRKLGNVVPLLPAEQQLVEFGHGNGSPCHASCPPEKIPGGYPQAHGEPTKDHNGCSIKLIPLPAKLLNSLDPGVLNSPGPDHGRGAQLT